MNKHRPNKTPLLLCALLMSLVLPCQSWAQESLNEHQAVELACQSNPTLERAALEIARARLAVEGQQHSLSPTLDAAARVQLSEQASLELESSGLSPGLSSSVGIQKQFATGTTVRSALEMDWTRTEANLSDEWDDRVGADLIFSLTHPWLKGSGEEIVMMELESAQLQQRQVLTSYDQQASQLAQQILAAYWELWYAKQQQAIQEASLSIAQEAKDERQIDIDLGNTAESSIIALQVELLSSQESLVSAQAQIDNARLALLQSIGSDSKSIDFDGPAPTLRPLPELAGLQERARERSQELAALEVELEQAQLTLRRAENDAQYQLDSSAGLQISGLDTSFPDALGGLATFQAFTVYLGIEFAMPLDSTQNDTEIARAELSLRDYVIQERAIELEINSQVEQAFNDLKEAHDRLELAQASAQLSALSVEAQRAELQAGNATAFDLVQAIHSLRQAELRVVRAQADIAIAEVKLDHLSGQLLLEVEQICVAQTF